MNIKDAIRPTPFPQSYVDLVFDEDGWSQTIIVDGVRPEWLRDDDKCFSIAPGLHDEGSDARVRNWIDQLAIRVRRRNPGRETRECFLILTACNPSLELHGTVDLIDGKPDLSTLKVEDAQ